VSILLHCFAFDAGDPSIFELAPESWYKVEKIDTVVFYLEMMGPMASNWNSWETARQDKQHVLLA
jgi:hypothetical protein